MSGAVPWRQRAGVAWDVLGEHAATRLVGPMRVHEPGRWRVVFAWPLSQMLHAAVLLAAAGVDTGGLDANEVWRAFRRYRRGDGFTDMPLVGKRYYDDNAWIGLACAQAALLPPVGDAGTAGGIPPPRAYGASATRGPESGGGITPSPPPEPTVRGGVQPSRGSRPGGVLPSRGPLPTGGGALSKPSRFRSGGAATASRHDWVRRAERSMSFVLQGAVPGGGVRWVEGGANVHACSTGAAGALAAALEQTSAWSGAWAETARAARGFLVHRLLRPDGLVADHITPDGRRDEAVYTYNQGLLVQLHLAAGDTAGAAAVGLSTLQRFGPEQLDSHPACFNAIFLRSLLRLWAATGEERWRDPVTGYLERCWARGRDRRGLLSQVGRYDDGVVLDHAALVGLMAAATLDRAAASRLC